MLLFPVLMLGDRPLERLAISVIAIRYTVHGFAQPYYLTPNLTESALTLPNGLPQTPWLGYTRRL